MQVAVVVDPEHQRSVLTTIRCATAGFVVGTPAPEQLAADLRLVVVEARRVEAVLRVLAATAPRARIVILWEAADPALLQLALQQPSIVGFVGVVDGIPEPWQLMYAARRVLAPLDPAPLGAQLMPWGATTVSWQPKTTGELRRIVTQIDGIGRSLGLGRREADDLSAAAHELLMNAMYDAPVDARGRPLYADDRTAPVQLAPQHAPTLSLCVGPTRMVLDAVDPFGRLPRQRYLEGVIRGIHNQSGPTTLDTSHGGAGLGLHAMFSSCCMLKAELRPLKSTMVSWMARRGPRSKQRLPRSLFFLPLM
ncbi:MAG TPA: hypothetical protein ENK18_23455 [Deltaproteobacteria bacterium]|nr:hypothetical protein [Deltaproteobacteria bacterium]